MSLSEFFNMANMPILLIIVLSIVQIAPIKINPWTAIAKAFGKVANGDVIKRIDALENRVKTTETKMGEESAISRRVRILRFGDELRHGEKHSKEHFDQILLDVTQYEKYCGDHPDFVNNVTRLTIDHIEEVYKDLIKNGGFI